MGSESAAVRIHGWASKVAPLVIAEEDHRSVEVEGEIHFVEAGVEHGVAEAAAVWSVEEQESAAAGSDEFAAGGAAGSAGQVVEFVDAAGGDAAGPGAFALPVFMQEVAEFGDVAAFEDVTNLAAEGAREVQAIDHGGVVGFGEALLFVEQGGGAARIADEEEHERVAHFVEGVLLHVQGGDADFAIGEIFLAEQAAVRGDVLVLLADGVAEPGHF